MPRNNRTDNRTANDHVQNRPDPVIGIDEFFTEAAEYLDEVSSGEILSADETDGSIEYFPTAKTDDEIYGNQAKRK